MKPTDTEECPDSHEDVAKYDGLEELDVADFSVPTEAGRPQTETRHFHRYVCKCDEHHGEQVYFMGDDGKLHTMRGVVDGEDQEAGRPRMLDRRKWK